MGATASVEGHKGATAAASAAALNQPGRCRSHSQSNLTYELLQEALPDEKHTGDSKAGLVSRMKMSMSGHKSPKRRSTHTGNSLMHRGDTSSDLDRLRQASRS
jgi:hypothetical protein